MKKERFLWLTVLGVLLMFLGASSVMAAYSAHQNDTDVNSFLAVYPSAKSTKLDDCALCHPGAVIFQRGKYQSGINIQENRLRHLHTCDNPIGFY